VCAVIDKISADASSDQRARKSRAASGWRSSGLAQLMCVSRPRQIASELRYKLGAVLDRQTRQTARREASVWPQHLPHSALKGGRGQPYLVHAQRKTVIRAALAPAASSTRTRRVSTRHRQMLCLPPVCTRSPRYALASARDRPTCLRNRQAPPQANQRPQSRRGS